jgi:hypothetical protein
MNKRQARSFCLGECFGCAPFKERHLVPGIVSEHERCRRVRIRNKEELLLDPDPVHPEIIVATTEVSPDTGNKGNLFSQCGNSCCNICGTAPKIDLPVVDMC